MELQPVYPLTGQAKTPWVVLLLEDSKSLRANSFFACENNPPYCRNIIENLIVAILIGDIVPQTQTWVTKPYIVAHKRELRDMSGGEHD